MPATFKTQEKFPLSTSMADLEAERKLRIKASAIRSTIITGTTEFILETEWNVIGEG
jgi:hypothetical protein